MKIVSDKIVRGRRRITVDLEDNEQMTAVINNGFYRLGGQLDEVVPTHVITEMRPVFWCHITQKWED